MTDIETTLPIGDDRPSDPSKPRAPILTYHCVLRGPTSLPDCTKPMVDRSTSTAEALCRAMEGNWALVRHIDSGNSGSVFHITDGSTDAALKTYHPQFFQGRNAAVEQRRLKDQISLKGHGHPNLIDVLGFGEAQGTHYLLMEYVPWLSLDRLLADVERAAIPTIIRKVASAAQYLESRHLVHRDIKPANILVSDDFTDVKLLDLGVMRPISTASDVQTDHGHELPFVATARYSSPAYLFRTGEPTVCMWKALTFYQLGATLHDLIMRRPLFDDEARTNNKYLVAAAVRSTIPKINATDVPPSIIALARSCLVKEDQRRLQLVNWSRFSVQGEEQLDNMRDRLGLRQRTARRTSPTPREYLAVHLDQALDDLAADARHVLNRENFPRSKFKTYAPSSTERVVVFSFCPDPTSPTISLHIALRLSAIGDSPDSLECRIAAFLAIADADVSWRSVGQPLWQATFEEMSKERYQLQTVLSEQLIRRFAIAMDELPHLSELESDSIVELGRDSNV